MSSCEPLSRGAQFAKKIRSRLKNLVAKTVRLSRPHTDDTNILSPTWKYIPYGERASLLWVPQKLSDYWLLKGDSTCRVTMRTRRRVSSFLRKQKLGTNRHLWPQHPCTCLSYFIIRVTSLSVLLHYLCYFIICYFIICVTSLSVLLHYARPKNNEKWLLASSCLPACLSVCLSVLMEQHSSHWTEFHDT